LSTLVYVDKRGQVRTSVDRFGQARTSVDNARTSEEKRGQVRTSVDKLGQARTNNGDKGRHVMENNGRNRLKLGYLLALHDDSRKKYGKLVIRSARESEALAHDRRLFPRQNEFIDVG
jgi:hypothetical protein